MKFVFPENRGFFMQLLGAEKEEDLEGYYELFDFRPVPLKRKEFNKHRNQIAIKLEKWIKENP